MRSSLLLAASGFVLAPSLFAQIDRSGNIAQQYSLLCASCHGPRMEGAQAPSMLDDTFVYGGDDDALARSIRNGSPDKGMPAFGGALSEKEIRAMVIYIREQRDRAKRDSNRFSKPADSVAVKSQVHNYQLTTWIDDLNDPWSITFLPDGSSLFTEKRGRLYHVPAGSKRAVRVDGVPEVDNNSQAGLFDLCPHPNYTENGWLYLAYSHPQQNAGGQEVSLTRVIRGKLRDGALVDQETVFQAPVEQYPRAGGVHFGGRLAFDREGYLFFTIGERGRMTNSQDLAVAMGKVHRVHDDGRIPKDNPFVGQGDAFATIWSYGHRNPQGLAFDPRNGDLYDLEHGPRGGDELNLVQKGRNYGWPVISYGMNYDGSSLTELTAKEGMEQPVVYWTPSLAVSGMTFYTGDRFPGWKHNLFIASLAAEELRRLVVDDRKVISQEVLFKGLGRIRDVEQGPDGSLYVLLPGRIARLTPSE
jgi:glucose/arabinose dehydrogenase